MCMNGFTSQAMMEVIKHAELWEYFYTLSFSRYGLDKEAARYADEQVLIWTGV